MLLNDQKLNGEMKQIVQILNEAFENPAANFVQVGIYNSLYKSYRIEAFKIKE